MTRHRFIEGAVCIEGKRFSLEKVLQTYVAVIDRLVAEYGDRSSWVSSSRSGFQRPLVWDAEGRGEALRVWRMMHEHYDAVDESLVHAIGPLSIKAYLLGKTWCVYRPMDDRLMTPLGESVGELDPTPTICVYGARNGDSYAPVSTEDMAKVIAVTRSVFAELGLSLETATAEHQDGTVAGHFGWLTFPHETFGEGYGPIMVRCVLSGGGEVPDRLREPLS